jgi:hypothetical protein
LETNPEVPVVAVAEKPKKIALKQADEGPRPNTTTLLPLEEYDLIIVSFSGGEGQSSPWYCTF